MLIIKRPRNRHADAADDAVRLVCQFPADGGKIVENFLCGFLRLRWNFPDFCFPAGRIRHTSFDLRSSDIQQKIP